MPSANQRSRLTVPLRWAQLAPGQRAPFWLRVEGERKRLGYTRHDARMAQVILNLKGAFAISNTQVDRIIDPLVTKADGSAVLAEPKKEAAPTRRDVRPARTGTDVRYDAPKRGIYNPFPERLRKMAGGRDPLTVADLPASRPCPSMYRTTEAGSASRICATRWVSRPCSTTTMT